MKLAPMLCCEHLVCLLIESIASLTLHGVLNPELNLEKIRDEVEKRIQSKGDTASARLDMLMTSALNRITSDINNTTFPKGLMKPFPSNCLSLMTITGAKGGLVRLLPRH